MPKDGELSLKFLRFKVGSRFERPRLVAPVKSNSTIRVVCVRCKQSAVAVRYLKNFTACLKFIIFEVIPNDKLVSSSLAKWML